MGTIFCLTAEAGIGVIQTPKLNAHREACPGAEQAEFHRDEGHRAYS